MISKKHFLSDDELLIEIILPTTFSNSPPVRKFKYFQENKNLIGLLLLFFFTLTIIVILYIKKKKRFNTED